MGEAAKSIERGERSVTVVMDAGTENVNATVDKLFRGGTLQRVLAQFDVTFSNSLIEAWWRSLKNQWLYLHDLKSFARLTELVAFYVREHNEVIPHSAFDGTTPDEVYFGKADSIESDLIERRAEARRRRVQSNRASNCGRCPYPARGPTLCDRVD